MAARRARSGAFKGRGNAQNVVIKGQNIPITVKRPTLEITKEHGANVRLKKVKGGTTRIIVGRERERGEESQAEWQQHAKHDVKSKEFWDSMGDNKFKHREYWENMVTEKQRMNDERYWDTVPWEEKWDDDNYLEFKFGGVEKGYKGGIVGKQRKQMQEKIDLQRTVALLKEKQKIEEELKKSWGQRGRNKGFRNYLFWRPANLAIDIASSPFALASKVAGSAARPISWVNDKWLESVGYAEKGSNTERTKLNKGTTGKDFFKSVMAERRGLSAVEKRLKNIPASLLAKAREEIRRQQAKAKSKAA